MGAVGGLEVVAWASLTGAFGGPPAGFGPVEVGDVEADDEVWFCEPHAELGLLQQCCWPGAPAAWQQARCLRQARDWQPATWQVDELDGDSSWQPVQVLWARLVAAGGLLVCLWADSGAVG